MFKSILWPVDGSPLSVRPMAAVIDLARLSAARVVLLSIAEPRLYRSTSEEALQAGHAAETERLASAKREVTALGDTLRQAGLECEGLVALSSTPGAEIVTAASTLHCDLIVMATRGKLSVLDTMLGESITQEVLKRARVPVMVFP